MSDTPRTPLADQIAKNYAAHMPSEKEVAKWDREHRQECQELHCTLAHRMLDFADWYVLMAREFENKVRESALRGAGDTPAPPLDDIRTALHARCQPTERCLLPNGYEDKVIDALSALRGNTPAQEPLRHALVRIEGWSRHFKDEAKTQIRGSLKLIHAEAEAALSGVRVEPRPPETDHE